MLLGIVINNNSFEQTSSHFPVGHARLNRVQSAQEIVRYYGIYRQLYGLNRLSMQMLRPIGNTLEVLLDDLGSDESRDAFIELSQLFSAFARRFGYVVATFRRLEEKVQGDRDKMPLEVIDIFERMGKDIEPSIDVRKVNELSEETEGGRISLF
jgi:hypothetical protein